jgi:hypothetical protein
MEEVEIVVVESVVRQPLRNVAQLPTVQNVLICVALGVTHSLANRFLKDFLRFNHLFKIEY